MAMKIILAPLPYLLPIVDAPVYGTRLTLGLVEEAERHGLNSKSQTEYVRRAQSLRRSALAWNLSILITA